MPVLNISINHAGYVDKEQAIRGMSFSIEKGELVGVIGPNGAGKSTMIKTILGLVDKMDGEIKFAEGTKYAYIPEHPTYYPELTLWEHIELVKAVNEMEDRHYEERARELLSRFRLEEVKHEFPSSHSKGMQQKLMIILAILTKPQLYIVDEPFIGLDPKAIKDFLLLLENERKNGVAILMSTHVLDTAEKICDRFLLINNGNMIAKGTLTQLQQMSIADGSLMDCFYELLNQS